MFPRRRDSSRALLRPALRPSAPPVSGMHRVVHAAAKAAQAQAVELAEAAHAAETHALVERLAAQNTQLKELQAFRDEMVALLVHDMKGPLSAITMNVDVALSGIGED